MANLLGSPSKINYSWFRTVMMFLEFFVWGAWFVTLGTYLAQSLDASGSQISLAFLTQSLGAIITPFVIGLIADQFFSAQKILGVLHVAGGLLLILASQMETFGTFFAVALIYMILFMPTLALVNSISFRQMHDPGRQFPAVRVLGTIGWIVAGLLIGWLGWEQAISLQLTFIMAGVAALVLGFITDDGHIWTRIWLIPAAFATVVLVVFWLLFREQEAVAADHGESVDADQSESGG